MQVNVSNAAFIFSLKCMCLTVQTCNACLAIHTTKLDEHNVHQRFNICWLSCVFIKRTIVGFKYMTEHIVAHRKTVLSTVPRKVADDFIKYETAEIQNPSICICNETLQLNITKYLLLI